MLTMSRALHRPPPTAELSTVSRRSLVTRTAFSSMTTAMPGMVVSGVAVVGCLSSPVAGDCSAGRPSRPRPQSQLRWLGIYRTVIILIGGSR
jgi:hypothetical protein